MNLVRFDRFIHVKMVSENLSTSNPPPFGHATAGVAFEFEVIAMPRRPKKPCAAPGCPELIKPGQTYCTKHRRETYKRYDEQRGTASQRGYGSRWARYARIFKRAHPLCRACELEGRVTPTHVVDHIEPIEGPDDPLFWDPSNHQSLCERCHNVKRATEDKETWSRRRGDG